MYNTFYKSEKGFYSRPYNGVNLNRRNVRGKLKAKQIEDKYDKREKITFITDFMFFVLRTSNIHGLRHLSQRNLHFAEYLLWLTGIIIGITGIYWLSSSTWNHYQNNPTVITIENNYQEWSTMFPSITVCPLNKITTDPEKFHHNVIEKKTVTVENEDQLYEFMQQLANWSYTDSQPLPDYTLVEPSDYIWIYSAGKHDIEYIMSYNEISILDSEKLNNYVTEHGICYGYLTRFSVFNDPQYWKDNKWQYIEGSARFGSNLLDGDNYFQFSFTDTKGFTVFIHSPEEIPDASSKLNLVRTNMMKTIGLTALSIVSSPEIKYLSVKQRKCHFPWESSLAISPVYTYNNCRMNCRHKKLSELCGCVPHFYRPVGNQKVCDAAGLKCVSLYKDLMIKLRNDKDEKMDCKCLPTCNDVNYMVEEERLIDWTFGAELRWGIIKYPRIRYKREIIFGVTDVLVSVGGSAGLFLGCSALSFAEIIFFLTLHLYWFIVSKGKLQHQKNNNPLQELNYNSKKTKLFYYE